MTLLIRGPETAPLVCHVCPTHLGPGGIIGGAERFVHELARAMARKVRVRIVSFGSERRREVLGPRWERVILTRRTRNPASTPSWRLFGELREADVIHCHQYYALPTFLAALYGRLRKRPVFATDLGGGGWTPAYHLDQSRLLTAHLPLSKYAASHLPGHNLRHSVIYGGVDLACYPRREAPTQDGSVVFLGRILPHKGAHFLIEGLPEGMPLHVVGPVADPAYLERLRDLAAGKDVRFHHGLEDHEIVKLLGRAMALVHPTPVDEHGSPGANELFGLALVEAMACGCPVVASAVGPLPEVVEDRRTGLLVPPNDPIALRTALEKLRADHATWRELSAAARRRVEERFTWDSVADRCLAAYGLGDEVP